jgi:hypothetical protein
VNKKASHSPSSSTAGADNPLAPIIGCGLLCLYLFFDGLTSTTQEHYFGKSNKKDTSPLTPSGPVLDQMVFVNFCATGVALFICILDWNNTVASLWLALSEPSLWFDSEFRSALLYELQPTLTCTLADKLLKLTAACKTVTMLSATATFGLIILYDTIFKHGALTVATVMTCRQFWSIIMNAGIFGNFGSVGFGGWTGGASCSSPLLYHSVYAPHTSIRRCSQINLLTRDFIQIFNSRLRRCWSLDQNKQSI